MATSTMQSLSPELLAANDGWLRALVRRLVDDGQTDDVLAEVWGQVMRTPPRDGKAMPAWLATVARRVAGKKARSAQRRRKHEQIAAETRPETAVDPAQLVARVEERQRVAQTVLALDEPFRTVVLLRYFEDLTPEQIAERLSIPGATVRSRLHRGHERLRAQFERERGAGWRGELALLCVPLGDTGVSTPAPAAKVAALVVAVPLLLAAATWWFASNKAATPAPSSAPIKTETTAAQPVTATTEQPTTNTPVERFVVAAEQAPIANDSIRVQGQIVDPTGHGLPNIGLTFAAGMLTERSATEVTDTDLGASDPHGNFDVRVPRTRGTLLVEGAFATLRGWQVTGLENATKDALVVATHVVQLAGHVVTRTGAAVPDTLVEVSIQDTYGLPMAAAGTKLVRRRQAVKTDANGHFALKDVPAFAFGDLRVGWLKAVAPLPTVDRYDLRIELGTGRRSASRGKQRKPQTKTQSFAIVGTVRATNQQRLAGAHVRASKMGDAVATEENGTFRIDATTMLHTPAVVWVAAAGHQPQRLEVWREAGVAATTCNVQLTPNSEANGSALAGKVVTPSGTGLRGMRVMIADATPMDIGSRIARYVEAIEPDEFGANATTDDNGQFQIANVLDRPYRVRVLDPTTGYTKTFGPLDPRRNCTLEVDTARRRGPLRVQIVDRNHRPVADADVRVAVVQLHTKSDSDFYTMSQTTFFGDPQNATTDSRGMCKFDHTPTGELLLNIAKPGWVKHETSLAAGVVTASKPIKVQLLRLMPIRVATHGLDHHHLKVRLFDGTGKELAVKPAWRGSIYPNVHAWGCHRGHSIVAAVAASACRAEIYDLFSNELLRSMPVMFRPNGVTVLDFPE